MSRFIQSGLGIVLGFVIVSLFNTCKHDPFMAPDDLVPVDTTSNPIDTVGNPVDTIGMDTLCDPEKVYFALQIQPILTSNCAFSGCHDAASAQNGVILTSYEQVMQTADVRAFDLDGSDLFEVITDSDIDKRMPPSPRAALSSEQINLIANWILQGAENLTCDPNATGCDTASVSYSMTIAPIIQNTCLGCHSGSAPSGGINMSSHSGLQAVALNGRLVGAISHDPGYTPMPQGGAQLSACTIAQISAWVEAGAPNN